VISSVVGVLGVNPALHIVGVFEFDRFPAPGTGRSFALWTTLLHQRGPPAGLEQEHISEERDRVVRQERGLPGSRDEHLDRTAFCGRSTQESKCSSSFFDLAFPLGHRTSLFDGGNGLSPRGPALKLESSRSIV
jgi:hypothetical protein